MLANRLSLDAQGRLILRENGKIVLPYEHFANAVMLKHMTGPHGLHLSVEATVRSVMESYTIGRENFGMEKEFIIEVVQSCPNPACRYYKTQPYMDAAAFQSPQTNEFMQHLSLPQSTSKTPIIDMTQLEKQSQQQQQQQQRAALAAAEKLKMGPNQSQHQITAAIIQQQNRAIAQQNLEKFNSMSSIEKQRIFQQFDKKQFEAPLHHSDSRSHERNIQTPRLSTRSPQVINTNSPLDLQQPPTNQQSQQSSKHQISHKVCYKE